MVSYSEYLKKEVAIPINQKNLEKIDQSKVLLPKYDRTQVGQGWIHIGMGAFHRAHQAVYQDDLFNKEGPTEWGICGMSLLKNDTLARDVFQKQDSLYTILERTPAFDVARIIGAIQQFRLVPDNTQAAIDQLASEKTKIVSFTITESGYGVSQENFDLDTSMPDIKHDLENPGELPVSTYGFLSAALQVRKDNGLMPFTMMSCDNIQHNGAVLKKMLLRFLELKDQTLFEWVRENGAFPSTMVDRITPAFSREVVETIRNKYQLEDNWPIACEPFKQWVVEDNFPLGRPQWENVGVQMVDSVVSYEKLKISVLNISMICNGFYAKLCGYTYMDESLEDVLLLHLIRKILDNEVEPLLDPLPDVNVQTYKDLSIKRVQNSAIKDTVKRLTDDASGKMTKMLFPTLTEAVRKGDVEGFRYMAFMVACFMKMFALKDDFGNNYKIWDPFGTQLEAAAKEGGANPDAMLSIKEIFPPVLVESPEFVGLVREYLKDLYEVGAQQALDKALLQTAHQDEYTEYEI